MNGSKAINFPLSTALAALSHGVASLLSALSISQFLLWEDLQLNHYFIIWGDDPKYTSKLSFLCSYKIYLNLLHCGEWTWFIWCKFFEIYWDLLCGPGHGQLLWMFHMCSKKCVFCIHYQWFPNGVQLTSCIRGTWITVLKWSTADLILKYYV